MANVFLHISILCFIFSGISFVSAVVLFFAVNTKAAYLELKGKPQSRLITANRENNKKIILETATRKKEVEDDAATTILYPRLERRKNV